MSVTERDLLALLASRALRDALADADAELRGRVAAELRPTERRPVYLDDDDESVFVGSVTLSKAGGDKDAAQVVDEAAFLAWVRVVEPAAVVESVAPWFAEQTKRRVLAGGEFPDPGTGEVLDCPPGVARVTVPGSRPSLRVVPDEDGRTALVRAVLSGRAGGLTLPAGDGYNEAGS